MAIMVVCGSVFDGVSDTLLGRTEILVNDKTIVEMAMSVTRSALVEVVDLSEYTVMPQMIVPGFVPNQDAWRELYLLVQSGVAAIRVLQAATSVAATLMGRADMGAVEPGKIASLIAVRGNPINDISVVRQPEFIMTDGRVLRRPSRRNAAPSRARDQSPARRHHSAQVRDARMVADRRAST